MKLIALFLISMSISFNSLASCDYVDPQRVSKLSGDTYSSGMTQKQYKQLQKLYQRDTPKVNNGSSNGAGALRCIDGELLDLGVYGIWLVGSYMLDQSFWMMLQLNYLNDQQRARQACYADYESCLMRTAQGTAMLAGVCLLAGTAAGPLVGAACAAGGILADTKARQQCLDELYRCLSRAYGRNERIDPPAQYA
jgi:hypothetical protein